MRAGEVVGLLGANGAGKTTTIRMLLNVVSPTGGTLRLFGETFADNRGGILAQMNAAGGAQGLPARLTVRQALRVFADLYGVPDVNARVSDALNRFDIAPLADRALYTLSTGQLARVSLAKALLNRPRLLLLDEPTASLDPDVADRMRTLLGQIAADGCTIFLATHNMAEAERLCSRVIFLAQGKILAEGAPRELAGRLSRCTLRVAVRGALPAAISPEDGEDIVVDGNRRGLVARVSRARVGPLLTRIARSGAELETVSIEEPTLEEFFLNAARPEGRP